MLIGSLICGTPMDKLTVAKFGGSALGPGGAGVPRAVARIKEIIGGGSRAVAVFSAPLTGQGRSVTDIMLEQGRMAESGRPYSVREIEQAYEGMIKGAPDSCQGQCRRIAAGRLAEAKAALSEAADVGKFADEVRSRALAYSGEVLSAEVMAAVLAGSGVRAAPVPFGSWPIITDSNIEYANFVRSESASRSGALEKLVAESEAVAMGGFIGRTAGGTVTTYERGGSDRTAADLAILLHKKYNVSIEFEKDSSVASADPKIVTDGVEEISELSYNEARLAGMFGMKILDPMAIKEILECGVDVPITISNINDPQKSTRISGAAKESADNPLKIVTGRKNCSIFRTESDAAGRLVESLDKDRRYGEFVTLSPFTRDGTEFSRMLFLDGDYVRRSEEYFMGFGKSPSATHGRGVITLIGDGMWRMRQVVSRASSQLGQAGINILNMDAQEETSRVIIIIDEAGVERAVQEIHKVRSHLGEN